MLIKHKITFDDKKFQKIENKKIILLTFRDDKFKKLKIKKINDEFFKFEGIFNI